MLNAPYNGGTHLPDITVVTPVFAAGGGGILFFVAARGHHADIGGIAPGSMSPKATRIEEEGVYIDPFKLVEGGRFREDAVLELLTQGPYPARDPEQNVADLKAQAAANAKGVDELGKMVAQYGLGVVRAYMGHVQDNAAASVARVIADAQALELRGRDRQRQHHQGRHQDRPRGGQGDRRLHRHQRASRQRLQCAGADHARLRALCVPHAGGRGHSAQRRLPSPDQDRRAEGFDAEAALSGPGRRRQCRDQPDHRQLPLRRARRARLGARAP